MSGSLSSEDDDSLRLNERQVSQLDAYLPMFWKEQEVDQDSLEEIGVHNFMEVNFVAHHPGIHACNLRHWSELIQQADHQRSLQASRLQDLDDLKVRVDLEKKKLHSVSEILSTETPPKEADEVIEEIIDDIEGFVKRTPKALPTLLQRLQLSDEVAQKEPTIPPVDIEPLRHEQEQHASELESLRRSMLESQLTIDNLSAHMQKIQSSCEAESQKFTALRSDNELLRKRERLSDADRVQAEHHTSSRINELERSLEKALAESCIATSALAECQTQLGIVSKERDASKLEHANVSSQLDVSTSNLAQVQVKLAETKKNVETIEAQKEELDQLVIRNNQLIISMVQDRNAADGTVKTLQREVQDVKAASERSEEALASSVSRHSNFKVDVDREKERTAAEIQKLRGFNSSLTDSIREIKKRSSTLSADNDSYAREAFHMLARYNAKVRELSVQEARAETEAKNAALALQGKADLELEASCRAVRVKELQVSLATSEAALVRSRTVLEGLTAILDPEHTGVSPLQLLQVQRASTEALQGELLVLQEWKANVEDSRSSFYQGILNAMFANTICHDRAVLTKLENDWHSVDNFGQLLNAGDIRLDVPNFHEVHGIPTHFGTDRPPWEQVLILLGHLHEGEVEASVAQIQAIGIHLRSPGIHATRLALILLYRYVRLRCEKSGEADSRWHYSTSIIVLRVLELMASHVVHGAAHWLISNLFETACPRFAEGRPLVYMLIESVQCRLAQRLPVMKEVMESDKIKAFLPTGANLLTLDGENILLVNADNEIAIVHPKYFRFHLDATDGWYVNFQEAPLIGTWTSPFWPHEEYLDRVCLLALSILPKTLDTLDGGESISEQLHDRI